MIAPQAVSDYMDAVSTTHRTKKLSRMWTQAVPAAGECNGAGLATHSVWKLLLLLYKFECARRRIRKDPNHDTILLILHFCTQAPARRTAFVRNCAVLLGKRILRSQPAEARYCRPGAHLLRTAAMLPAAAPTTDVGVCVADVVRNSLKTDSLTDSQHSSGDTFSLLEPQARAAHCLQLCQKNT